MSIAYCLLEFKVGLNPGLQATHIGLEAVL